MSFFSAEACHPRVADLAGLLCATGRTVTFAGSTARLEIPVADPWRQLALVRACAERGVGAAVTPGDPEDGADGEGPVLRTAFRADLAPLAADWGEPKKVPAGFVPDGAVLRLWVAAAGRWADGAYLLPLDPDAPHTHDELLAALGQCGLPAVLCPTPDEGSALKVVGRRRLARLLELVGPPAGPGPADQWPAVSRMRVVS